MSIKSRRSLRTEPLEPRMMLAGDVLDLAGSCAASLHGENGEAGYVVGDANRDGSFNQLDIQSVLQAGKYATGQPADWSEGDWTGDDLFDQMDLILALQSWPDLIPIPQAFEAEGIEMGSGQDFFVGGNSWSGELTYVGAVYKGNLCTGEGELLVQPQGRKLAGLSYDARTDHLYGAAGNSGGFSGPRWEQGVSVYDASTGEAVAEFIFPSSNEGHEDGSNMVINDILVTEKAVYATDSVNDVLYRIPLADGGELVSPPEVEILRMTGFEMVPDELNANGLVGDFDGNQLVVVNITSGVLYRVDTETGAASAIDIQGDEQLFIDGDGLYMDGRTLYIMQNFSQKIAVVQLSDDLSQGTFVKNLLSDDFAIPTTITGHRDSIYAINTDFCARTSFCGLENPDTTQVQSNVVRVDSAPVNESARTVRLSPGSDGLADAIAAAGPRGTVIVEAGIHTESSSVMITDPITIVGEEGAVIELDSQAATESPRVIDAGLHVKNTRQVQIRGLEIRDNDTGSTAILIEGSEHVSIEDNRITDFQFGVAVESADDSTLHGNVIGMSSGRMPVTSFGIIVVNGSGNQVSDNTVSQSTFGIFASGENGKLLNNTTNDNFVGVNLCNLPANMQLPDGRVSGSAVPATGWLAEGNTSTNNTTVGYLVIDGSNNNTLTDNQGGGNGTYDIELAGLADRFGLVDLPASHDNVVNAVSHEDVTIKDCGTNNQVHGGDQVDTGVDACPGV